MTDDDQRIRDSRIYFVAECTAVVLLTFLFVFLYCYQGLMR